MFADDELEELVRGCASQIAPELEVEIMWSEKQRGGGTQGARPELGPEACRPCRFCQGSECHCRSPRIGHSGPSGLRRQDSETLAAPWPRHQCCAWAVRIALAGAAASSSNSFMRARAALREQPQQRLRFQIRSRCCTAVPAAFIKLTDALVHRFYAEFIYSPLRKHSIFC